MFLNENYVLSNELTEKMGIHTANVSIMRKKLMHNEDTTSVLKRGECTFINCEAHGLPKYIKKVVKEHKDSFTDMSDKIPCRWFHMEYHVSMREAFESKMVLSKIMLCDKLFYVFAPDFIEKMKGKIGYVLNREETMQCMQDGDILGYTQLKRNKFFTWY